MASTIKVDNVQNTPGTNIINKCGTTITIGASSDTINLASGASQTGFGRTGTVDWQTGDIKTGGFTAASGKGYFVNTTSGGVTATLPSSPSAGDIVGLKDYALTFDSNELTIGRGGSPINGGASIDPTVSTAGATVMLVYVDGTKGWIPTQDDTSSLSGTSNFLIGSVSGGGNTLTTVCTDYKLAKFTGPGTFTVCSVGSVAANNLVSYLVVGGGGGGGATQGSWGGGGGGAGGFREVKSPTAPYTASPLDGYGTPGNRITVTATGYPITVGGGGAAGACGTGPSGPGSPAAYGCGGQGVSSVFSTITGAGGGYGGGGRPPTPRTNPGGPGGSGGGTASPYSGGGSTPTGSGGTGNTPPVTPAQGFNAGTADGHGTTPSPAHRRSASGGGGATTVSSNATGGNSAGGTGATTTISASPTAYSGGGGGGGAAPCAPTGAAGGTGGGGAGAPTSPGVTAGAGTVNTGGGGGGGGAPCASVPDYSGGAGGSGIVYIRYKFQ